MGRRLAVASTVYAWCDPRTGAPRYVGISDTPQNRLNHRMTTTNVRLLDWLCALEDLGLRPLLAILQRDAPPAAERRWIARLKRRGYDLLNIEKTAPLHDTAMGWQLSAEWKPRRAADGGGTHADLVSANEGRSDIDDWWGA